MVMLFGEERVQLWQPTMLKIWQHLQFMVPWDCEQVGTARYNVLC